MYDAQGWSREDARFFVALCDLSMHPEGGRGVPCARVVRAVLDDGRGDFTEAQLARTVRRLLGARMIFHQEGRFRLTVVGSELFRAIRRAVSDRVDTTLRLLAALPPHEVRWNLPRTLLDEARRLPSQAPMVIDLRAPDPVLDARGSALPGLRPSTALPVAAGSTALPTAAGATALPDAAGATVLSAAAVSDPLPGWPGRAGVGDAPTDAQRARDPLSALPWDGTVSSPPRRTEAQKAIEAPAARPAEPVGDLRPG